MIYNQPLRIQAASIRPVTYGPKHHFFGYYDKCPWDTTGRYLLAMELDFMDRQPNGIDEAVIGTVDLSDRNRFTPFTSTRAWNWQQGCMLQWLPSGAVIYNDRVENRFVSVISRPYSGERCVLSMPIHAVSPDGLTALSCDFSRMYDTRPGYGYPGIPDRYGDEPAPSNDGVWHIDLTTGEVRLILSLRQLADAVDGLGYTEPLGAKHWVNHIQYSPDGARFVLLHRCGRPQISKDIWWKTWMFTAKLDGTDLTSVSDHGMVSHFDWLDTDHILAWATRKGLGDGFFLFSLSDGSVKREAEGILTVDGHCSYSPDRRWLMTDTYPDEQDFRKLLIYDLARERSVEIGSFYGPYPTDIDARCDLHARWSRNGKQVCIDSIHEGSRQMYVIDIPEGLLGQAEEQSH